MPLYVVTNTDYIVNSSYSCDDEIDIDPKYISYITVTGSELEFLKFNFKNVPFRNSYSLSYFGDMAKFIVTNWRS